MVQLPEEGRPVKFTLPVGITHVGCVMVPTKGVDGLG